MHHLDVIKDVQMEKMTSAPKAKGVFLKLAASMACSRIPPFLLIGQRLILLRERESRRPLNLQIVQWLKIPPILSLADILWHLI
jgi:hypothetical protein